MYLSIPIVGLILWIAFIGFWIGGAVGKGAGAFFGTLAGAGVAAAVVMTCQQSEVSSTRYYLAKEMIKSDCRMTPLARTVLADKKLTEAEYWRLEDQASAIELGDARSDINGDALRQCPTSRS
jgi:hypothetical protein